MAQMEQWDWRIPLNGHSPRKTPADKNKELSVGDSGLILITKIEHVSI